MNLECTPGDGQVAATVLDYQSRAFEEKAHGQAPQLFDRVQAPGGAGVSRRRAQHGVAKRHLVYRNLIRIWVAKFEAGGCDDDTVATNIVQVQDARISARCRST